MTCLVLANAILEKFGADTVGEIDAACTRYRQELTTRLVAPERP